MKFEAVTWVSINNTVLWEVTPCSVVQICRHFRETVSCHVCRGSSETSVNGSYTAWYHIQKTIFVYPYTAFYCSKM